MTLSLEEIVQAVAGGLSTVARKPNILNYVPNEGAQKDFHSDPSPGRLLAGDNRSGKTVAGICEDVWWATGRHPFQKTPEPPVFGRIITVDFDYGADQIIEPALAQWTPPSELKNGSWEDSYNRKKHVLSLRNGSRIEIKAKGQALESFAGTPRHFLHVDEECPKAIFLESKTRLIDYKGHYWITMTPVEGITWIYTDLVERPSENIKVFRISIRNNRFITEEGIGQFAEDLDAEETQIRLGGGDNFIPRGGLVFKNFDRPRHVIKPGMPPRYWSFYNSIDPGFNNPTAILWHAVSPEGEVVTFFEHYKAGWTAKMHCDRILEINKGLGITTQLTVGDPSMAQRSKQTGHSLLAEYKKHGVPVMPGKKHVDNSYIDRMNEYLRQNKWHITENCPNMIKELMKLPWKVHRSPKIADQSNKREEPLEKDDHAIDSTGYFFQFMPDLRGVAEKPEGYLSNTKMVDFPGFNNEEIISKTQVDPENYPWRIDRQLARGRLTKNYDLSFGEVP